MPFRKQREATFYDKEILKRLPMDGVPTRNVVIDSTTVRQDPTSGRYVLEAGQVLCRADTNENQTITLTGVPTGGDYRLGFDGEVTAVIAYNAAASVVRTALEALRTIGAGNVAVSGSGPYTVVFQGTLRATNNPLITVEANGLTGGTSPRVVIAESVTGHGLSMVRPAADSGEVDTDIVGILTHTVEFFYPPEAGITDEPAAAYYTWVEFDITKLVGYSGNAAAVQRALPDAHFSA